MPEKKSCCTRSSSLEDCFRTSIRTAFQIQYDLFRSSASGKEAPKFLDAENSTTSHGFSILATHFFTGYGVICNDLSSAHHPIHRASNEDVPCKALVAAPWVTRSPDQSC